MHCFLLHGKKCPDTKLAYGLCHVPRAKEQCNAVPHCCIASSKATALLIAPGGIIYISPPSGTGHFSCILVELCWLEQFPLLALVPCPSPPVGTGRKMKVIFFILLHSWQDEECWVPRFLFVIRPVSPVLGVKSKVILLKFEKNKKLIFFKFLSCS